MVAKDLLQDDLTDLSMKMNTRRLLGRWAFGMRKERWFDLR